MKFINANIHHVPHNFIVVGKSINRTIPDSSVEMTEKEHPVTFLLLVKSPLDSNFSSNPLTDLIRKLLSRLVNRSHLMV